MTYLTQFIKDKDETTLPFGKYKGQTPNEIAAQDPSYIVWLYDETDKDIVSDELYEVCECDVADMKELGAMGFGCAEWWKD